MSAAGGLAPEVPAEALDPELMSRWLGPLLGDGGGHRVVAARVLAIAPGRRAVIGYDTAGPRGAGPALIGKTYAEPVRAGRLHALLERLSALGMGVPRPVAHLPALSMAVFTASPGLPLDRLRGAERAAGTAAAARWLATLHGSPLLLDRRLDLAAETGGLEAWAQNVAARHRPAARAASSLAARLAELSGGLTLAGGVPIHRDLHYRHTLVEPGGMVVIDLDEARAGDPSVDVAHFTANLRLLALREGAVPGELTRLEAAFLAAYASATGYEQDARHSWFGAQTCLKIARQLACGRGPAPVPTGAELDRQLLLILDEGHRWLAC